MKLGGEGQKEEGRQAERKEGRENEWNRTCQKK